VAEGVDGQIVGRAEVEGLVGLSPDEPGAGVPYG